MLPKDFVMSPPLPELVHRYIWKQLGVGNPVRVRGGQLRAPVMHHDVDKIIGPHGEAAQDSFMRDLFSDQEEEEWER